VTAVVGLKVLMGSPFLPGHSPVVRKDWRLPAVGVAAFLAVLILCGFIERGPEIHSRTQRNCPGKPSSNRTSNILLAYRLDSIKDQNFRLKRACQEAWATT
jgi:hypothetical protein